MARILAGPWAGQLLADLGADVVKVERPQSGDDTRAWGPPFVGGETGERGDAAYFHSCNRGKRSIAVDIAHPSGRKVVEDLCAGADIVIENFKAGALAKYGLDYPALAAKFPRLIYCSITGFGLTGPYAPKAGYDFIVQAMGGIMDLTGEPDGPPEKAGVATADIFTGLYAVIAIQAALLRRVQVGRGGHVDMALLDTQVGVLANQALNYLVSRKPPRRMGNRHPNLVPYEVFSAADGPVVIAVGNDRQNADLCRFLGLAELASDPRFSSNAARVENREAFVGLVAEKVAALTQAEIISELEARDIPVGPINRLDQVFADPQVTSRGMRIERPASGGKPIPGVRSPIIIDGSAAASDRGAPRLGQHSDEILAELGYPRRDIETLRASGIVG